MISVGVNAPGKHQHVCGLGAGHYSGNQSRAGDKPGPGFYALTGAFFIEHRSGADDHIGITAGDLGDGFMRLGKGQRDFKDGNTRA